MTTPTVRFIPAAFVAAGIIAGGLVLDVRSAWAAENAAPAMPAAGQSAQAPAAPQPLVAPEPPSPAVAPQTRVIPLDIAQPGWQEAPPGHARGIPLAVERRNKHHFVPQAAADVPPEGVVSVALNKSRPVDIPGTARDVVVGNPAIADVLVRAPHQVFIMGRAIGSTNVFLLDGKGGLLRRLEIHVGPDAEAARAALAQMLPDDDIEVTSIGDALFLTGKVRDEAAVNTAKTIARRFVSGDANVVNQLVVVGAQQVLLRVRVAEMNRNVVKQLGMRSFFNARGNQVGGVVNGGNVQGVDAGGIAPPNSNYSFPVTGGTAPQTTLTQQVNPVNGSTSTLATVTPGTAPNQNQPIFGFLPGTENIFGGAGEYSTLLSNNPGSWLAVTPWNLLVNYAALEQEGLAKTLSEPNLTTVSGEAARLLAGGEVPIPSASVNGVVTVDFKPFGVGLVFSPVILSDGNIRLKLESEVSAIDKTISVSTGAGINVPGFKTRRATTVVELPSGGSLMIAGLLEDDMSNALNAVPGLRDVPILGALFSSTAFQHNETELVVTVSAYLVNPVEHSALDLPTDGFLPSSDLKRYFLLHLQENYVGKKIDLPPTALKGPVGYIVD